MGHNVVLTPNDADSEVSTKVIKVGSARIVVIRLLSGGRVVGGGKYKVASEDDLDKAVERALRAALSGKRSKDDVRVGEIEPDQTDDLSNRIEARSYQVFGFGPSTLVNVDSLGTAYFVQYGYAWDVTSNSTIMADFEGAAGRNGGYFAVIDLGVKYFMISRSSSPYVAAELGLGAAGGNNVTDKGGFTAGISLGYQFFRTSTTQFLVNLSYKSLLEESEQGNPGLGSANIGIYF